PSLRPCSATTSTGSPTSRAARARSRSDASRGWTWWGSLRGRSSDGSRISTRERALREGAGAGGAEAVYVVAEAERDRLDGAVRASYRDAQGGAQAAGEAAQEGAAAGQHHAVGGDVAGQFGRAVFQGRRGGAGDGLGGGRRGLVQLLEGEPRHPLAPRAGVEAADEDVPVDRFPG